jgi:hydroxyacylglutathione hydrolase
MSASRSTDFSSIELNVAVEPSVSNRTELISDEAPPSAQQQLKSSLRRLLFPAKFILTIVAFLVVIAYMVPVLMLQGIGMLGMMHTMPKIMIYVYPSSLGKIHVLVLWAWRKLSLGDEGHTRSVRIELEALEPREGQPEAEAEAEAEPPHTMPYAVHTVACLLDNYAYIIVDLSGRPPHPVALVDPCEPEAVVRALERLRQDEYGGEALEVTAVLCTHHHWDHAWGNRALLKAYPGLRVYGGAADRVSCCTHRLYDGDTLRVGSLTVTSLSVPCHTRGSVLYCIAGPTPAVFGGDTLFCGGCGAPFEGTQEEMNHNFAKIWRYCPGNTLLFPGHEYSLAILPQYVSGGMPMPETAAAFAKLCSSIWRAHQLRSRALPLPTVPLLLEDELALNVNFAPLRRAATHLAQAWRQHESLLPPHERAAARAARAAALRERGGAAHVLAHPDELDAPAAASLPPSPPSEGFLGGGGSSEGAGPSGLMHRFGDGSVPATDGMIMLPAASLYELTRLLSHEGEAAHAAARRLASELCLRHLPTHDGGERAPLQGSLRGRGHAWAGDAARDARLLRAARECARPRTPVHAPPSPPRAEPGRQSARRSPGNPPPHTHIHPPTSTHTDTASFARRLHPALPQRAASFTPPAPGERPAAPRGGGRARPCLARAFQPAPLRAARDVRRRAATQPLQPLREPIPPEPEGAAPVPGAGGHLAGVRLFWGRGPSLTSSLDCSQEATCT